ncbi:MAG TPA: hypothetical protein PL033_10280 [Candidatus Brocadiia bacterium]|nr:hypothetical protein [Candidatus Brocadiia bacterium]
MKRFPGFWLIGSPVFAAFVIHLGASPSAGAGQTQLQDETIKAFCVDFNWGDGGPNGFARPGLWADASPAEHAAWYAGVGCNVIQTFAVSCNGYAWYKNGFVPEQPGMKSDFLTEMVRLGRERKMRVMGYFCVGANTRWGLEHPELSYGAPSAPHIPFTNAYLDYLCASIEDALKKTDMDGFMIDWVWNPGDLDSGKLRWLECEKAMYAELFGEAFPGDGAVSPERELEFRRRAAARCWERIRASAKRAKPDCVIWLSCCNVNSPVVVNSKMFAEVDWLMNEAPDAGALARTEAMKGPHTRLIQCVVGWGDNHDARSIVSGDAPGKYGIYGFAKPGPDSLPLRAAEYRTRPIISFRGNDRNIAVLSRFFNGQPLDMIVKPAADNAIMLTPETANAAGNSPVMADGQIGDWGNPKDSVFWLVDAGGRGRFEAHIEYAVAAGMGGSLFTVRIGDKSFDLESADTGSWRNYRTFKIGVAELNEPGIFRVSVEPRDANRWKAISLKSLSLMPAR